MAHYGGTCVLNEKAVRESGDDYGTKPIGTGPYKFVSWVKGDRITLIRNDDYWGEPAKIKNIVIRPIAEATNRTIEMETGGVDLAFSIQPLDMGRIESNPKLKLMRNRDTTIYTVGMNTEKKPLDDIRVRRAISLAIDANALNKAVYRGIGTVGRSIVPPTIPYYDEDSPEHEYSPEKAKQLLAEAGYDNGLKLTLVSNENKERIDTMTIVQNMLGKVGIESEIQVIEWGVYLDKLVQGEYDLCTGGWSCSVFDPDEAVYGQYHSSEIEVGYNWVRLRDAKTDELIEEGRATADKTKRAAIYKALQDRIRELYPVVVTQSGEALIAMSAELKGVSPNALDLFDFCKAYFE
jgi:peptide/nickel transport system substrate-binding protein